MNRLERIIAYIIWILLAMAIITAGITCSGCHGISPPSITAPSGATPGSILTALVSVTSIPYLGIIAISGAVFIAFIGNPKLGMAVGAAGGCALAMSLAVIKYAWLLGLLSVVAMIAVGAFALLGNRKFKKQLVQGIENVKDLVPDLVREEGVVRSEITDIVAKAQTPDVTAQVLTIKKGMVPNEGSTSSY